MNAFDRWKKETYPAYWSGKSREYGLDGYCCGLIDLIKSHEPACAFELAIGNVFPFAENLQGAGIAVSGCDISDLLIQELKRCSSLVRGYVGGYEDMYALDAIIQMRYDIVYCLRSTWYFTDIAGAITFMMNFVRPGGTVIFDIMNLDSPCNRRMVRNKYLCFPVTILKNLVKTLLNVVVGPRYMRDKVFGIKEIMYSRVMIESILNERGLNYKILTIGDILRRANAPVLGCEDQKLIFVVQN